ncbi:MAG: ankyrin repeat domain-containing protein [Pirellulaceae bacterium]
MAQSADRVSDETVRFHRIVAEGDVKELEAALKNGVDVNAPGHVGMTALMLALAAKDLGKAKLLIQNGADPELTDEFNATALGHAVAADFADGVRFLLSLGVDRGYDPRHPLKKIDYDTSLGDVAMPVELKGILSEAQWKESVEETRRSMREMGQNPTVEPTISAVQSVEVLKLFVDAGDDLNLAPTEVKRALVGLQTGGELRVSRGEYLRHKSPRYGSSNPERMDFPFWKDMIQTGSNAYSARKKFNDEDPFIKPGAVWCYERFGSSLTPLKDGRFVQIGGEHEDFYDPDFVIYNDVVIHDGKGDFEIYGYPRDVFPPTDFHTATLCRDGVYIVGCLGYMEQRQPGFTSVYRLRLESWQIETVKTSGEMPGWIHKHRASYEPERNAIRIAGGEVHMIADGEPQLVSNEQQFELDLSRLQWRRMR